MQHPCAMAHGRTAKILVADVAPQTRPGRWVGANYRRMPLPGLDGDGEWATGLDRLDLIPVAELTEAGRVAPLSPLGVNLLMQRWGHHNARVVVWTRRIDATVCGSFEEADLVGDAVSALVEAGRDPANAEGLVDTRPGDVHVPGGRSRRDLLTSQQEQSTVRAALRRHVAQILRTSPQQAGV